MSVDKENRKINYNYNENIADSPVTKKTPAFGKPIGKDKSCWQGVFEGWLEIKKGGFFSSEWKTIWSVIGTEGNFHIFDETDAPKPMHVFPLHSTVIKDLVEKEAKGFYEISLECPKKKLSARVRCESKASKTKWMGEFRKAVCRPNKHSLSQFEVTYKEASEINCA